MLAGHDWQRDLDDESLAGSRLRAAADVTEHRAYRPGDEHPTVIELRQGSGFGRTLGVDTALAAVVGACDGELTLGEIVTAVAEILDADAAALQREILSRVRELLFAGFLLPHGE